MAFGKRIAEFTGVDITNLIHNVVESFADKHSHGLGESQHAPKRESLDRPLSQNHTQTSTSMEKFTPSPSSSPTTCFSTPLLSSHRNPPIIHRPSAGASKRMAPPVADIDDTAAFMAAARSFKLGREYGKPPVASESASSERPEDASHFAFETTNDGDASAQNDFNGFNETSDFGTDNANGDVTTSLTQFGTDDVASTAEAASFVEDPAEVPPVDFRPQNPKLQKPQSEVEDREHLTTFKSWGVPVARDRPAAQVRRCIIKGLPAAWATPDKVLSLVHGGMIESVSITATGNAHVLFCDPAACRAFFDRYPNGIDLDKERKLTVFVDLGNEVDVVSSQLSHNLSVGSSRVVRAIGVEMDVIMMEIVRIAAASNRKVEKIIDNYVPGAPRTVIFRFCSIDDAVRFRTALVRNDDWEHCNIHFTTDPCEAATGYHAD